MTDKKKAKEAVKLKVLKFFIMSLSEEDERLNIENTI